jgi:ketosteroid isomerase-like protein
MYLLPVVVAIAVAAPAEADRLDAAGFAALANQVADGWNRGDASTAADAFTDDAIYVQPPRLQLYRGRAELFRFFGGDKGRAGAMQMRWHRLAFDAASQSGFGEFSFRYGSQVHGVAVIKLRGGRIAEWREYWTASELPFAEFVVPGTP